MVRREHAIRGMFSFLAASTLLYMAAENADYLMKTRDPRAIVAVLVFGGGAIWEAYKVGTRVEYLLGLRDAAMAD